VYFAAWSAYWVFLFGAIAAQKPDPTAPDGDPCCPTPDTWGEVASWVAGTLVVAALHVDLLAAEVAFLCGGRCASAGLAAASWQWHRPSLR
jgi:hypothetical protein